LDSSDAHQPDNAGGTVDSARPLSNAIHNKASRHGDMRLPYLHKASAPVRGKEMAESLVR